METLQKVFNFIVGVHQPWYAQCGRPVAAVRAPLPPRVEMPACWRRATARRVPAGR